MDLHLPGKDTRGIYAHQKPVVQFGKARQALDQRSRTPVQQQSQFWRQSATVEIQC